MGKQASNFNKTNMRIVILAALLVTFFSQSALALASSANPAVSKKISNNSGKSGLIHLKSIELKGNKIFTQQQLLSSITALGDFSKINFNRDNLEAVSNIVMSYYRANGYDLVVAKVESLKDGKLTIKIIENTEDLKVVFDGVDDQFKIEAQKYFEYAKNSDQNHILKRSDLERVDLLLKDISGYDMSSEIVRGEDGGGLKISAKNLKRFGGLIGVDNHGNRYTGAAKASASLYAKSVFKFGDQINVSSFQTQGDLWYGSLSYSTPVGYSGLRTNFGYSHVDYTLGKEYDSYNFNGTTNIVNAGLSYPIIRSTKLNLSASVNYNHKWFVDSSNLGSVRGDKKHSDVVPIMLNFSGSDKLFGGGYTYGYISWTHGVLSLGSNLKSADDSKGRSDGHFDKFNFDIARIQAVPVKNLTLFARGFGQSALKNLDPSERFALGGANAVRAYPFGENSSDEGFVTQFELRYAIDKLSPYIFYDFGHSKTSHNSWSGVSRPNQRSIAGGGAGLKFNHKKFVVGGAVAWRTVGSYSLSDKKAKTPTIWLNLAVPF
jgi:hemolysin activation/secretion protein